MAAGSRLPIPRPARAAVAASLLRPEQDTFCAGQQTPFRAMRNGFVFFPQTPELSNCPPKPCRPVAVRRERRELDDLTFRRLLFLTIQRRQFHLVRPNILTQSGRVRISVIPLCWPPACSTDTDVTAPGW